MHHDYARKTLYAFAPCHEHLGTEYLDQAVQIYYQGSWPAMLRAFVEDGANLWYPTWIKRNYYMENPPDLVADTAVALQE